jgi:hypothetical protein
MCIDANTYHKLSERKEEKRRREKERERERERVPKVKTRLWTCLYNAYFYVPVY